MPEETSMLGPLPLLHQVVVVLAAILTGATLGFWTGGVLPLGVEATTLGELGAVAGGLVAYLLLHDTSHRPASRR